MKKCTHRTIFMYFFLWGWPVPSTRWCPRRPHMYMACAFSRPRSFTIHFPGPSHSGSRLSREAHTNFWKKCAPDSTVSIFLSAYSVSALESPSRRHPDHISEPSQLAPLDVREQLFHSEFHTLSFRFRPDTCEQNPFRLLVSTILFFWSLPII